LLHFLFYLNNKIMKTVIIASKNPVKIESVKIAFEKMFLQDKFEFIGESITSNVSDQPMSDEETLQGATNRATNAQTQFPEADFWVGLEGGLEKIGDDLGSLAWIVVKSKDKIGKARALTFLLPPKVTELIKQGKEMSEASNIVFGVNNSQHNGTIGTLTNDIVTRTTDYTETVVLALIPFKNPELY